MNIAQRMEWCDVVGGNEWKIEFRDFEETFFHIQHSKVPEPMLVVEEHGVQIQTDHHVLDL